MRQNIKHIMRFYSLKKCFRLKRVLVFLTVSALISSGIKMKKLFRNEKKEFPSVVIKKYEVFKYVMEKFSIGSFLKKKSPGNMTYCNFRLGDSDSFNYTEGDVAYSPELGDKSPYRVLYGVVKGFQFNMSETNTVTYATHITLRYLFHIVEIVTRWNGPISVACFLPGTDAILALKILEKMCFCLREMENVNINFVYHKNHPPRQMSLKNYSVWLDMEEEESQWRVISGDFFQNSSLNFPQNKSTKSLSTTCYVPEKVFRNSYRIQHNLVYPINVARNVARYGSKSKYILVSDIELLPSDNMVEEFLNMIKRLKKKNKNLGDHYFTKKKHVFVVPVFEVSEKESDVPHTKAELLDLYSKEKAVYFHRFVCIHCQRFPGIQKWLQKKVHPRIQTGIIQPLLVVKREFPYHRWEPVYIGTNEEPLYSELLTWEGQQDKMTQMHEMCLLDYRFVILNGAFLVHTPGIKQRKTKPLKAYLNRTVQSGTTTKENLVNLWLDSHAKRNSYLYHIITQEVMSRYRYNPKCLWIFVVRRKNEDLSFKRLMTFCGDESETYSLGPPDFHSPDDLNSSTPFTQAILQYGGAFTKCILFK